jgi:hypothetical protein
MWQEPVKCDVHEGADFDLQLGMTPAQAGNITSSLHEDKDIFTATGYA